MSGGRLRRTFNPPLAAAVAGFRLLAAGTWRWWRWALLADAVLLGSQLIGAAGSGYELVARGGGDKGVQLRAMGVDPFFGVLLDLAVSLLVAALFVWALARLRAPTG